MRFRQVTLHHIRMKLKSPFTASYGSMHERDCIIVELMDEEGVVGWGESTAFAIPWYTEETTKTNWHLLEDFLIPLLLSKETGHPAEVTPLFSGIRRNPMAKAALEGAVWDVFAQRSNASLAQVLGGSKQAIEVGVAIGIVPLPDLLRKIEQYLAEGYKRIKVKIKPGHDLQLLHGIRQQFPDIPLMADANSAYTWQDLPQLQALDEFRLMMIEQPFSADDIVEHAKLQAQLNTPICLDESILTSQDAKHAIELGSCRVINIKIGRVGGLLEAGRIHDICQQHQVAVWCGGMLETGIGRAHNIALTTLPHFLLPGDTSGSARYWDVDIIEPEVVAHNGMI
ncbi:MAG: O-succinylbenzoate synthase, partial [Bacilli bacterium]|nr:O-succinylbenzoate synthase [Bacilli bacterium]